MIVLINIRKENDHQPVIEPGEMSNFFESKTMMDCNNDKLQNWLSKSLKLQYYCHCMEGIIMVPNIFFTGLG